MPSSAWSQGQQHARAGGVYQPNPSAQPTAATTACTARSAMSGPPHPCTFLVLPTFDLDRAAILTPPRAGQPRTPHPDFHCKPVCVPASSPYQRISSPSSDLPVPTRVSEQLCLRDVSTACQPVSALLTVPEFDFHSEDKHAKLEHVTSCMSVAPICVGYALRHTRAFCCLITYLGVSKAAPRAEARRENNRGHDGSQRQGNGSGQKGTVTESRGCVCWVLGVCVFCTLGGQGWGRA